MFAGPTLARARRMTSLALPPEVEVLPPAGRGDVAALIRTRPPGGLVLVDGLFHQRLAVGHAELRDALAAGWRVWGLSSMGAIRARELASLGMRGFGQVYAMYTASDRDVRDDEVVLLHAPAPTYEELSEPLVHLRHALASFARRALLAAPDAEELAAELADSYFGDRTLARFAARVAARATAAFDPLVGFDEHRVKCQDLIEFVRGTLPGA